MLFLQLLPVICALLFTFTRKIDIRVTKADTLTVKINLNIFAILLTEDKIRKRGIRKLSRLRRSFRSFLLAAEYLVSRTEIKIYEFNPSNDDLTALSALLRISLFASLGIAISYLEKNASSVKLMNKATPTYQNKTALDFSIHFSLWNLIIFASIFLYYKVKSKIKRVLKNV